MKKKVTAIRNAKGQYIKGNQAAVGHRGRPPNVKNRSMMIKLAWFEAFEKLGGIAGLVIWAKGDKGKNKKEFYRILATMLPKDLDVGFQDDLLDKYEHIETAVLLKKAKELANDRLFRDRGSVIEAKKD